MNIEFNPKTGSSWVQEKSEDLLANLEATRDRIKNATSHYRPNVCIISPRIEFILKFSIWKNDNLLKGKRVRRTFRSRNIKNKLSKSKQKLAGSYGLDFKVVK